MSTTLGGFFSGGAKGVTWPETPQTPGGRTFVTGVIETVHPPEPIVDLKTGQPTDRQQVRIMLKTDERDPAEPDDDGRRTLYVKSWMRSAIGDALRKAGAKEPEVGGTLSVTFTHLEAAERPGMSPSKKFSATYSAPPVTGGYFGAPGAPQQPAAPVAPQQPVAQQAYQPPAAPPAQPVAQPQAQQIPQPQAVAAPVKPPAISDAAWAAMDAATQATVAATMAPASPPPPY